MIARFVKLVTGAVGVVLLSAFVIGLSHSISSGFAGFLGGLPFAIIVILVLAMAVYDFWDECIRRGEQIHPNGTPVNQAPLK